LLPNYHLAYDEGATQKRNKRKTCIMMYDKSAIAERLYADVKPEIFCDYQQTIGLLTKVNPELKTMLRQKVQQGNIHISWKPMSQMRRQP
jgi:hypothetical protein